MISQISRSHFKSHLLIQSKKGTEDKVTAGTAAAKGLWNLKGREQVQSTVGSRGTMGTGVGTSRV